MNSSVSPGSFRVGTHLLVVVGIGAALFSTLGLLLLLKKGDAGFLIAVLGATVLLLFLLSTLRLEVSRGWLRYQSIFGSRAVPFANVARAYIAVSRHSKAPQGVASFWMQQRGSEPVKVNLRVFPVQAAAMLFSALEAHGIQMEVPDEWSARRMQQQINAAREKAGL